jgi:hypothetical protein
MLNKSNMAEQFFFCLCLWIRVMDGHRQTHGFCKKSYWKLTFLKPEISYRVN